MKDNLLEFYVNSFDYLNNSDKVDLSFLAPIIRRRMSTLDKIAVAVLNNTYTENIQNIVFSSQYGEVERLLKIINQYTENKEVSPNTFSGSVHNYAVGFFLLNKQKPISYTALSACEHSISIGILTSVISEYDNVLFCYADSNNEKSITMAINLTKIPNVQADKYTIKLENNTKNDDTFDNYIDLFTGRINTLKTPIFTIKREIA